MAGHRPVIPPAVAQVIRSLPPELKRAVRAAVRKLASDPAAGEPLQRDLQGYCKYRVRRFRLIYRVDHGGKTIRIVAIGHRRSIYEELADLIRQQK
jgi:mRNA interferase RelE/StbE